MKRYIAIGTVLAISIGINIWFFSGKGITVNQDRRVINNNNNSQWQGQLLLNQWTAQGNAIEWKSIGCESKEQVQEELNRLHPISCLYAKITYTSHSFENPFTVIYPDIFTKTKE